MNIGLKEAADFLKSGTKYIIYTHASPDGDTIGSATALTLILRAIGKEAVAFCPDSLPHKLSFIPTSGIFVDSAFDVAGFTPISVDVAGPRMLGGIDAPYFALSIDHHKINTIMCDRLLVFPNCVAAGEIVFMLAEELGVKITAEIALPLYTAICSDSGCFRFEATRPETHRMAARLLETGIDFAEICRRLFEHKSMTLVALERIAYQKLAFMREGRFAYVAITPEELASCGGSENDFESINGIPREIDGVLASAVIRRKGNETKISMRSNTVIDVADIAQAHGGGGHSRAAGFSISGGIDEAVELVKSIFSEINL